MKRVEKFRVLTNNAIANNVFIMVVQAETKMEEIFPGQFVNILVPNSQHAFLRRPISICDVDKNNNTLKFYIQQVGEGTKALSKMKIGDTLDIMYPLGNGFQIDSKKPLLVGGGCGIAPLVYLSKCFFRKGIRPTVLLGGRNEQMLCLRSDFEPCADVYLITDDGSLGEKGVVTQHSLFSDLSRFDKIYSCGPQIMMKAVAKLAINASLPCMVSLENTMACGIGACLCCVTKTDEGHKCVCSDGPVFDVKTLQNFVE